MIGGQIVHTEDGPGFPAQINSIRSPLIRKRCGKRWVAGCHDPKKDTSACSNRPTERLNHDDWPIRCGDFKCEIAMISSNGAQLIGCACVCRKCKKRMASSIKRDAGNEGAHAPREQCSAPSRSTCGLPHEARVSARRVNSPTGDGAGRNTRGRVCSQS